jgi:carnitine 3-dehydrogenase
MTDIRRVAVISTGVIGASWAALFLAHGLDVTATDPAPGAETALRAAVAAAWPALTALGLAPGADPARLRFVATPEEAVAEAEFVQENGPEDLALKQALFARLDAATPPGAVIASSSSSLLMTEVARECPGAARILGKHPIRLKREIRGHVANRLQAALWQEAFHLLAEGVADLADIDAAIAQGPGLRWALLGPFLNLDLSGGPGGIGAFFGKPLWNATEALWAELGRVRVDKALAGRVVDGVAAELAGQDKAALVAARDAALIDLLRRKRDAGLG